MILTGAMEEYPEDQLNDKQKAELALVRKDIGDSIMLEDDDDDEGEDGDEVGKKRHL
jgi:hypothetical protein